MSASEGNPGDPHAHGPPPPPEPKTPMWLPALGAVLFLTVGLVWALTPTSKNETEAVPAGSAGAGSVDGGAPNPHEQQRPK